MANVYWCPPRLSIYSELMFVWSPTGLLFVQSGVSQEAARQYIAHRPAAAVQFPSYLLSKIQTSDLRILRYDFGTVGCCLCVTKDQSLEDPVRQHTVGLIVSAYRGLPKPLQCRLPTDALWQVLNIFEHELLFDAFQHVHWIATGRQMFLDKLRTFLDHGLPIEMALPAFPCKTSNPEKAASRLPDGAEYLALQHLYSFCIRIGDIYKPGCYINIISDGHVFSDCIGVNDKDVDLYNGALQSMLDSIRLSRAGGIRFYNLRSLLVGSHLSEDLAKFSRQSFNTFLTASSNGGHFANAADSTLAASPTLPSVDQPVNHPVRTQLSPRNELDRALLLRMASPPEIFLQDVIRASQEHPLTALFRGFSRFMFEDLAFHPDYIGVSAKQRQKVAEKVAIEMILRNQSYSRLVEMVMPGHLRLSIHAHNNAGPKFAVRTLPKHVKHATSVDKLVKSARAATREVEREVARETLHIPTPWHNTLARAGSQIYICKHKIVQEAANSEFGVVGGYREHEEHGIFVLEAE